MARNEPRALEEDGDLRLQWSRRWSLTQRILAVNVLALALLAGGFFYLDSYRTRLIDQRTRQVLDQARLIAEASSAAPIEARAALLARLGSLTGLRLRVFDASPSADSMDGPTPPFDSWRIAPATYSLRDPTAQPWQRAAARTLDRAINFVAGAAGLEPFVEPPRAALSAWPEAVDVYRGAQAATRVRQAPDLTPVVSAAIPIADVRQSRPDRPAILLATINARDVTRIVRAERMRLGLVLAGVTLVSVLLSLFLARTIARPLQRLAIAAHRVRLGRAREVKVPRLPSRRDEIGLLARALHDMTYSLRYRIDATEAFAADVTHELKNPLASLRSAVDSLERVDDPALRRQLLDVVRHDVRRLDRLIVDIAEVSRLDAELSRARFERVDLGKLIESLTAVWETRAQDEEVRLAFARPHAGTTIIMGEESRLARVFDNIVDNAISFSPAGGLVEIAATAHGGEVIVSIEDEGAGIAAQSREAIFHRFHSMRPEGEAFGRHSGLGLAIAKAIVEGHSGGIVAEDRRDGRPGARFVIRFQEAAA